MAAIDDLLDRVEDSALREALAREFASVRGGLQLGLVFERHLPESVRLPGHPIRKGLFVEERSSKDSPRWKVRKVTDGLATISRVIDKEIINETTPVSELVVVRQFGEAIYPGLKSVGTVARGGDKPWHSVINAENYQALEALLYSYEGQVDCIIIDPPYNTGKDTWRYNDRYMDRADIYRPSTWLAFMERRLILAHQLLKPTGVILISIDDNQQARLKLLCDQIFGDDQFIASMIWKKGGTGKNDSDLVVEHEYIITYGKTNEAKIRPDQSGTSTTSYSRTDDVGNYSLVRLDQQSLGYQKTLDFPINDAAGNVYLPVQLNPEKLEARWRWGKDKVKEKMDELVFEKGFVFTKNYEKDEYAARSLLVDERFGRTRTGGKDLAIALGSKKQFDYPKPVKLIEYLLGIATGPNDLVLDFFGGSGTTAEAVMSANAKDGGQRRCILVTNNELPKSDAARLQKDGIFPGDEEWEAHGVFQKVARPRIQAVTSGEHADGEVFSEGYEENVEFFELTYEDRDRVSLGAAFEAIAPLLWMRAGAVGPRINKRKGTWSLPKGVRYGMLFDPAGWREFVDAVNAVDEVKYAFIVTDSSSVFQQVVRELSPSVTPVRMYENYLDSFEINTGGML